VYQSQHRDAVAFVQFAVEQGAIKLPAKQADKYDVLLELVQGLTVQWCLNALDPDLTQEATEAEILAEEADDE